MDKKEKRESIKEQASIINNRLWIVFLAIAIPFLFIKSASFIRATSSDERLLIVVISLFAFGLAFVAFKLVSYSIISRYLDEIQKLDTAKSDFISIASHQLKSPVSSLKYTMDVFHEALENKDWETVEEFSGDIKTSVNRLNSLTHQLLDVARAEVGSLESHPEEFSLLEKVDAIKAELEPIFEDKGVTVSSDYKIEKTALIKVDPDFFYNVLANLLTNASKYAPKGTDVGISIMKKGSMAEVAVENTARSLQKGDLDGVFEKFNRGSGKSKSVSKGAGLGLFIAKTYVGDWGGSIGAEVLDEVKERVVFSFTVPIVAAE